MSTLITKRDQLMRDLFSYSIGFDSLFNRLSDFSRVGNNFPPYNIVKDGDKTFVEMALAGYGKDDIEVVVSDGVLSVKGTGHSEREGDQDLHRGIASRRFTRSFSLGEHIEVNSAEMKDGMLTIELQEVLPPEKQPKVIEIK